MSKQSNKFLAQMPAQTIKGNSSVSTANPSDLTGTQVTALLDNFTSSAKGLAPASGGGTTNFLRADGTWTTPTATVALNYRAIAGTGTVLASDDTVALTTGNGDITLPTAVGNSGKRLKLVKTTDLSTVKTIFTVSGQTIGGYASGDYYLYTLGESLDLVSDGSNWLIYAHFAETEWVSYTLVAGTDVQATTTNPAFATTTQVRRGWWRRSGENMFFRFEYAHTNNSGATNGSGDYLFRFPLTASGQASVRIADYADYGTVPGSFPVTNAIGHAFMRTSASLYQGSLIIYSPNFYRVFGFDVATYSYLRDAVGNFANAQLGLFFEGSVRMTNWRP
jgi:hypothetical protein